MLCTVVTTMQHLVCAQTARHDGAKDPLRQCVYIENMNRTSNTTNTIILVILIGVIIRIVIMISQVITYDK